MTRVLRAVFAAFAVLAGHAHAQLTVEITGGGANQIPVAILPFAGESAPPAARTEVIDADLARSGRFRMLVAGPQNPPINEASNVDFAAWRSRGADALAAGGVYPAAGGRYEVRFRLFDVPRQASLGGLAYTITPAQ